jgi:hypothetical protein
VNLFFYADTRHGVEEKENSKNKALKVSTYKPFWEEFSWIIKLKVGSSHAYCSYCKTDFSIASCGKY